MRMQFEKHVLTSFVMDINDLKDLFVNINQKSKRWIFIYKTKRVFLTFPQTLREAVIVYPF